MGKKRKGFRSNTTNDRSDVLGSDDEALYENDTKPDPDSVDYIYDEIDQFHQNEEKLLLDNAQPWIRQQADTSEEEEVLSLESSTEDEEENEENNDVDMASDIEAEEDDDGLPSDKAWGKNRKSYYSTDYVDEDFGAFKGTDAELAEEEEKEALALQKKLAQNLDETDFGLELFKLPEKPKDENKIVSEKITKNFSNLSKKEKLELLKKESPELMMIIQEFQLKISEVKDRLSKVKTLIDTGKIPTSPGTEYVLLKYHLYLNYCINILFYLNLKAERIPVKYHPVILQITNYFKLLEQLKQVESKIEKDITVVVEELERTGDFEMPEIRQTEMPNEMTAVRMISKQKKKPMKPLLGEPEMPERRVKFDLPETEGEKEAALFYEAIKKNRENNLKKIAFDGSDSDDENGLYDDEMESEEANAEKEKEEPEPDEQLKRGINYQISKNKGLTPRRKKELRNPRVKHRMKFKKAKIRRKGQVREPRTELRRYDGELSGIKIGVKKGTKLH